MHLIHHGSGHYPLKAIRAVEPVYGPVRTSGRGERQRIASGAVDADGLLYLLTVAASLRTRLLGADPRPQPPPLVIGAGGRDGESLPLRDRRLEGGDA